MKNAVDRARARSGTDSWISNREACSLAFSGRFREARSWTKIARDQAMQIHQKQTAAQYVAAAAVREGLAGDATLAKIYAREALALSKARDAEYGAALALTLAGDNGRAQELTEDLERRFPLDTSVRFTDLPVLRALLALHRGDSARALTELQQATPDELGTSGSAVHAQFGALYPVYIRGEAYLAQQNGPKAITEFRRVLDHREIIGSDVIGALANFELGRAYALAHDDRQAKLAFENFVALWHNGDLDSPKLLHAKGYLQSRSF